MRTAYRCRAYPDAELQAMLNRTFGCVRVERRLKRCQRRLARCKKGSADRARARVKVARAHARIADWRRDLLHRKSTELVRARGVIAVGDLAVRSMVGSRELARAISCPGWAEFGCMLEYKAQRYGRAAAAADRWFPSGKTCSACGFLLAGLSLSTRMWQCPSCGTRHEKDINAAKNILAAGLAAAAVKNSGDACGADVRHGRETSVRSAVKQELPAARPRIPVPRGGE